MSTVKKIKEQLMLHAVKSSDKQKIFFKTGCGGYAEHDQFLGVPVPLIRKIAKLYADIPHQEISELLQSAYNEERLFALIVLVGQYEKSAQKELIYDFYLKHKEYVNNWNLVDSSAHFIVGAHLFKRNKSILLELASSEYLWDRRIAIVATWHFIRQNELDWTFKIAKKLMHDGEDLIHKAVGWMLREAGKKDQDALRLFLNKHAAVMPRTMLRYSIEKFDIIERRAYLSR